MDQLRKSQWTIAVVFWLSGLAVGVAAGLIAARLLLRAAGCNTP